jgi:hypothetical protein
LARPFHGLPLGLDPRAELVDRRPSGVELRAPPVAVV